MPEKGSEVWTEALIFLSGFAIINGIIMLVFWFSYAITSSSRMSSLEFTDFNSRRNIGDDPNKLLLLQEDQDLDALIARASGLFSNPRQSSSSSSDRSSLSDLGFNSSSDEEFIASMSGQALRSTTASRLCHRTVSLQKQPPKQQQTKPESLRSLQSFEEEDSADFKQLLTGLSIRKNAAVSSVESLAGSILEGEAAASQEFLRYHKLVPMERIDPFFLRKAHS